MLRPTTVSAVAVLDLHELLLVRGAATEAEMEAAGLDRETLVDRSSAALPVQEQRLHESRLLALWQIAARSKDVPHIGLLVGQAYNPSTRGVLASWLFQCNHLGEALQVFQNHIALMNPSESWTASETKDSLLLAFSFAPDKNYPRAAIERSMSALLRWTKEMTGAPIVPSACEFAFSRPSYPELYSEVFGENVRFECERNCIHLPREFLHRPIHSANAYLKQILEERALQTFQQLDVTSELSGKVRQRIQSELHLGLRIDRICESLHVSRPTLYRRLKREGTCFTELVETVRKDMAYKQIRQGLPVASVSDGLGFKDVSTFHRAFRRWFNQSPGECRVQASLPVTGPNILVDAGT